ncbi:MAG: alpha/beta hydrolase [Planctomycetota bacterium]|jgi:alpha-beta hydrolase superfamily lysophospholipase
MKFLAMVCLITVGAYAASCLLYYLQQDRLLFIGAGSVTPPSDPRIQPVENVVNGLHLRGVRVLAQEGDTVLLYFGGNAEPVVYNSLAMLRLASVTAYLIDYRGYGASDGSPSEPALRADALAHFDWIRAQHPESRMVLVGRSLGSAMALHVATRRDVDGIILISPFTSIRDVAAFHLPWLPVRPLLRHPFDTVPDARRVEVDTLVIAAENDSVIPRRFTDAFVRELPTRTKAHIIPGADHNDLMARAQPWALVRQYLDDLRL